VAVQNGDGGCGVIEGIGPDVPVEENERGGKQSKSPYRFDLMDGYAMFRLAKVLADGEKRYPTPDNWRHIDEEDHVNHALQHLFGWLSGDTQDDHLGHAFCRLMFAIGVQENYTEGVRDGLENLE